MTDPRIVVLEAERDGWKAEAVAARQHPHFASVRVQRERAEAAEAQATEWQNEAAKFAARLEAAEAERDELKRLCEQADADFHTCMDARQALEAERDKLKEALAEIATDREWGHALRCTASNVCDCAVRLREVARAALAAPGNTA